MLPWLVVVLFSVHQYQIEEGSTFKSLAGNSLLAKARAVAELESLRLQYELLASQNAKMNELQALERQRTVELEVELCGMKAREELRSSSNPDT